MWILADQNVWSLATGQAFYNGPQNLDRKKGSVRTFSEKIKKNYLYLLFGRMAGKIKVWIKKVKAG